MHQDEFFKYIESPEFKEKLAKFEEALSSGELVYFESEDLIDIGEYYHVNNDWEMAERVMKYCLNIHEDNEQALLFMTRLALLAHNDVSSARRYYSRISSERFSVERTLVYAEILMCEGRTEDSDEYLKARYEELQHRQPSDDEELDEEISQINFPMEVAVLFTDHGIYDLGMEWLSRSPMPDNDYDRIGYWDTKAVIYLNLNRFDGAKKALNQLLDIDSYNTKAWMMLASAHVNMGENEDALHCCDYAIAIDPHFKEAYVTKAIVLFLMQRYKECAEMLRKMIKPAQDGSTVAMPETLEELRDFINNLKSDLGW